MPNHPMHSGPGMRLIRHLRPADWLSLAGAPTFIAMAVATAADSSGMAMVCAGGQGALPLTGMTTMYLLMSAFHLAPWLRLASRARTAG